MPASRNFEYKAGQYVLLQVPVLGRWQWHPFTISTCIANELRLHIKTDGNWTGKHRKFEKKLEDLESGIKVGGFFCGTPVLADACRALTARGRENKTFIEYHFMMEVFGR
ncbi:hypothetical protein E4T50_17031 [Aureobasidium sp. EXF-12298]|nr:hypothetical protein E4T50_17031 [Aureobasidium sp. EXF-12298]KAI4757822.1 hypothetical protein E4T51_09111 [Aureobasidium sp. EXF-12344]KAI4778207.1 hypothetical protein E4T52_06864 [Aureobasidium sp. EXF-3400]